MNIRGPVRLDLVSSWGALHLSAYSLDIKGQGQFGKKVPSYGTGLTPPPPSSSYQNLFYTFLYFFIHLVLLIIKKKSDFNERIHT